MSRPARVAAIGLAALFLLQAAWAARRDASVADEHPHLASGWLYWTSGRFSGGVDNPPLGQLLVALPLVLRGVEYRFADDAHLFAARLPVILLGAWLAWLMWRWGNAAGGTAAGLGALLALALEPNLIAHGHLATLDFPVTVLWLGTLWAARGIVTGERVGAGWHAAFAACFALACLVKFTGVLLVPAVLLAALAARSPGAPRRAAAALVLALAVTLLATYAAYGFGPLRHGFPERLVAGIAGKWAHRDEVRFAYLAGRRSTHGFAAYYLAAHALKTPLPLLGLAALGAARGRLRRADLALLLVPSAVVVAAFTLIRVDIGLRHVLPVMPGLAILAGVGAARLGRGGRVARAVLAVLVAAWAAGVLRVAPQYLAYFNVAAGGAAGGHRWLLDSNLDWGQDDARLERVLVTAPHGWEANPKLQPARPGRFAVSANALHALQRKTDRPYDWLVDVRPDGFAGFGWRLYDLDRADFETHAARRPDDALAQVAAAEASGAAGDTAEAARRFEAALERFGGDPRVASRAAGWWRARGDLQRAANALRHADGSGDVEWGLEAEHVRLAGALAAARDPESRARARLDVGLLRAQTGDVEGALPLLVAAADSLPHDVEAQRALAVARAHLGRWAEAAAGLAASEAADACAAEIEVCRRLDAGEDLRLARRDAAGEADLALLFDLGRAHFDDGRMDAAAGAFAAILRTRSDDAHALAYLCEAHVRGKLHIVADRVRPQRLRSARGARIER